MIGRVWAAYALGGALHNLRKLIASSRRAAAGALKRIHHQLLQPITWPNLCGNDKTPGKGLWGSLSADVELIIRNLQRDNVTLRRSRYPFSRRLLGITIVGRTVSQYLCIYLGLLIAALSAQWALGKYLSCDFFPDSDLLDPGFIKDVTSYLLAGQIGVLAIVSVAIAVVTLLSDSSDGAAVNTNVRLYYVESYAYELTIGGVALLLVLSFQFFWPLQRIAAIRQLGGPDGWVRLILTLLHTGWFCVNLHLFLQFLVTTLRFVEPSTREKLRERYTANEILPRDAKIRLKRAMYNELSKQLFGVDVMSTGPQVMFGHPGLTSEQIAVELKETFRTPTRLVDVRTRPLRWAISRWRKRAARKLTTLEPSRQPRWTHYLALPSNFDGVYDGVCDIILRRGDVALTALEKWVIRRSLKFSAVQAREEDLPAPGDFLEQLVDQLVRHMANNANTGFRATIKELVSYHRFVLAAQNTEDDEGHAANFAQVGGWWSRPDADLVHKYRRAFFAAAEKIGIDTSFIEEMSSLVWALIPEDGISYPSSVIRALLDLGLHEVIALQEWVKRNAVIVSMSEEGTYSQLTGPENSSYERVLLTFVGAWETLETVLMASLEYERRPRSGDPVSQWSAFAHGYPVFETHLRNTAYFFLAAVWYEDSMGVDRFRDLLVQWSRPLNSNLYSVNLLEGTLLIAPHLVGMPWSDVQSETAGRDYRFFDAATPPTLSSILLLELYNDTICISGLIALHWYARNKRPSKVSATAATKVLKRERLDFDGTSLVGSPKSIFRLLLDFCLRYAMKPRFADGSYGATINSTIEFLKTLAEPRMINGRIYGGAHGDGFTELLPVLLAAMSASLPSTRDPDLSRLLDLISQDSVFSSHDSIQSLIWTLKQMIQVLEQTRETEEFAKAAQAFNKDIELKASANQLLALLQSIVNRFETLKKDRLRAAPLDEARMNIVRANMSKSVLSDGPSLPFFKCNRVITERHGEPSPKSIRFGTLDRGVFTSPVLASENIEELSSFFVKNVRLGLSREVWQTFVRRPMEKIDVAIENGKTNWKRLLAEAPRVGASPIMLVPDDLGNEIFRAIHNMGPRPEGIDLAYDKSVPSGAGARYHGTLGGVAIYEIQGLQGTVYLCSGRLIRTLTYIVLHEPDFVADFKFLDGEDLEKSYVEITFDQRIEWENSISVQFMLKGKEALPAQDSPDKPVRPNKRAPRTKRKTK